ncbi:hypothetical protein DFQ30_010212 [Apophysomyces sp. BC1015]|nr:hypothetical protein DFQ30_010212 [Apophysomyces sp. BC1015]
MVSPNPRKSITTSPASTLVRSPPTAKRRVQRYAGKPKSETRFEVDMIRISDIHDRIVLYETKSLELCSQKDTKLKAWAKRLAQKGPPRPMMEEVSLRQGYQPPPRPPRLEDETLKIKHTRQENFNLMTASVSGSLSTFLRKASSISTATASRTSSSSGIASPIEPKPSPSRFFPSLTRLSLSRSTTQQQQQQQQQQKQPRVSPQPDSRRPTSKLRQRFSRPSIRTSTISPPLEVVDESTSSVFLDRLRATKQASCATEKQVPHDAGRHALLPPVDPQMIKYFGRGEKMLTIPTLVTNDCKNLQTVSPLPYRPLSPCGRTN